MRKTTKDSDNRFTGLKLYLSDDRKLICVPLTSKNLERVRQELKLAKPRLKKNYIEVLNHQMERIGKLANPITAEDLNKHLQ